MSSERELAGVSGRDPERCDYAWGGGRDERRELPVELGDLVVKECDASREAAESERRGVERLAEPVSVRAQSFGGARAVLGARWARCGRGRRAAPSALIGT